MRTSHQILHLSTFCYSNRIPEAWYVIRERNLCISRGLALHQPGPDEILMVESIVMVGACAGTKDHMTRLGATEQCRVQVCSFTPTLS